MYEAPNQYTLVNSSNALLAPHINELDNYINQASHRSRSADVERHPNFSVKVQDKDYTRHTLTLSAYNEDLELRMRDRGTRADHKPSPTKDEPLFKRGANHLTELVYLKDASGHRIIIPKT